MSSKYQIFAWPDGRMTLLFQTERWPLAQSRLAALRKRFPRLELTLDDEPNAFPRKGFAAPTFAELDERFAAYRLSELPEELRTQLQQALQGLGFKRLEIEQTLGKLLEAHPDASRHSVEDLVRLALKRSAVARAGRSA